MLRFSKIATNGISLHVAEAGPSDGPLLFLLHGFPEFWYCWRNQIAPLAERGFHVVVPDQRGYNLSDKPAGVASYDLDVLAADILGLADFFHQPTFALAGHDWGAAVGWWLASRHSGRIRRFAALNAPHPERRAPTFGQERLEHLRNFRGWRSAGSMPESTRSSMAAATTWSTICN
jgi:epoxide hydrolase 4